MVCSLSSLTHNDSIQRIYVDTAEFFYDPLGGHTIGGVWNPSLRTSRPWKVLNDYSTVPTTEGKDNQATLNVDGVIAEIQRMGLGLVETIELRK